MARVELTSRTLGRPGEQTAPLSFAQLQIWLMDQVAPGDPSYALPVAYRLRGSLNVALLESSVKEVVRRHDILRTTFLSENGEPVQTIHESCDITLKFVDLSAHAECDSIETAKTLASAEVRVPFDLETLPLFRVTLFRLNDEDHILLINLHHIVADGLSLALLLDELHTEYTCRANRGADRTELPIQYHEFARRQRLDNGAISESDVAFWKRYLEGVLPLELPLDTPRPRVQSFDGRNEFFDIPLDLVSELTSLGAREGCTLFVTLLTAFETLLSRYSGSEDFVVGMPVALRSAAGVESLIGNFLNVVPLRCDLQRQPTFLQLLRRTRATTFRALSRATVPFPRIVENISAQRDASRNPIFQVMFELLPAQRSNIGPLAVELFEFELGYAQFDLSLHVWEQPDRYACRFEYCTRLFSAPTAGRMAANFVRLLREIVANPERAICQLDILAEPERSFVLGGNAPSPSFVPSDECVHHVIERVAVSSPDLTAVTAGRVGLTYRELSERSSRLANHLIATGVQPGDLVGVCLERSIHLPVALLAVLKAGAAYVPLDPLFPADRLAYMLDDARVSVLVTQGSLRDIVPGASSRRVVSIDEDQDKIRLQPTGSPSVPRSGLDLAYTIYTSGSSGRPKGVMVEHRALINFLRSMQTEPGFTADDVLVSVTTVSFDIAGLEIFLPLVSAAKLVIATKPETLDGHLLLDLLRRSEATVLQATPSTWKLLLDAEWNGAPDLKMLCGGEPLPQTLAEALITRGRELWNMYGPTETTIWSSALRLAPDAPVLIGPPIANTRFYVVDQYLEPAALGVPGELLIGGDGLARGYLGRDDLTSERFTTWSSGGSPERVYRTGDRVRLLPNGCYEFLGRLDFQVKLRGYRIELGEIEHALALHDAVEAAVVMVRRDRAGDDRLVAYYKATQGAEACGADLRAHLQTSLPDYMCPATFVEMEHFPLTANGKIDRQAFPEPGIVDGTSTSYAAPEGDVEIKLATIWERILNRQRIGVNEDFFEIGGHSLLAARLFLQLQREFGVKLPLALLFQVPTIRGLAKRIEGKGWRTSWRSLVPIRSSGTRAPLFLVHGAEGNVLLYRNLAAALHDDQPVYGLQARGLDGTQEEPETIERMAAAYVSEIRMVQPHGPYYLGGYCLGGTIALEMAQQLERLGERVAFVALLETYNIQIGPRNGWWLRCVHAVQNTSYQLRNVCLGAKGGGILFLREKMQVEFTRFRVRLHVWYAGLIDRLGLSTERTYDHIAVVQRTHGAQAAYRPSPYPGQLALFRPRVHFRGMSDPFFGWGDIAGGPLRVVELPNFPHGSLNTPFVSFVADRLRELMDESATVFGASGSQPPLGFVQSTQDAGLVTRAQLSSVSS
jgi:amino acid adenylation domain-containing protein